MQLLGMTPPIQAMVLTMVSLQIRYRVTVFTQQAYSYTLCQNTSLTIESIDPMKPILLHVV